MGTGELGFNVLSGNQISISLPVEKKTKHQTAIPLSEQQLDHTVPCALYPITVRILLQRSHAFP